MSLSKQTKCPMRDCALTAGHRERGQPWCVDGDGQRFTWTQPRRKDEGATVRGRIVTLEVEGDADTLRAAMDLLKGGRE